MTCETRDRDLTGYAVISSQATIRYDGAGDGSNDTMALSTDPALPGIDQPTSFTFAGGFTTLPPPIAIPVDGCLALFLLAMAVLASARRLPRRNTR